MKIFKKFLAALIAVVMALGIFAFAACKDDGKGSGNGDGEGEGPNGGTTLTTAQLLNTLQSNTFSSMEVNETTTTTTAGTVVSESAINGKLDFSAKNGDFSYYTAETDGTELVYNYDYAFIRAGYVLDSVRYERLKKDKVEPEDYSSIVLQYTPEASISFGEFDMIDFMPVAVNYVNYVLAKFADVAGALTIESGKATIDLNKAVYTIVQDLSEVVDGLEDTTTVGDILANENIKKYLTVFTELIPAQLVSAGLEQLPELLEMLNSIDLTDEEVAEQFGDMAQYIMMAQMLLDGISFDDLAALVPKTGSTTYDYLVKILGSDALKDIVNTVLANFANMGGGAEQAALTAAEGEEAEQGLPNLTNISLGLILNMVNAGKEESEKLTLEGVKTAFAALAETVTEESFPFTIPALGEAGGEDNGIDVQEEASAPAPMYISNVKLEYTLSGNKLTAQSFAANAKMGDDEEEVVTEVSASITYSAVKYQLADVSNNTVWYMPEAYQTGTTVSFHQYMEIRDDSGLYGGAWITYTVDFEDGVADPESLKVYNVDLNDPVRYQLDPATELTANPDDGSYSLKVYAYKFDDDDFIYDEETNLPVCDKTKSKDVTFTLEVTAGGIVTQEYLDSLTYQPGWDCIGEQYVEATLTNNYEQPAGWIGGQLSGKVGDLLAHLKAQASQPNA